jgi:hypothetical protein
MKPAFDPSMWGPGMWFVLHLSAVRYPERPTAADKKNYAAFVRSLQYVLPCDGCCKGFQKILEITNFGAAHLANRNALFKWTVDAHNLVNAKVGKRVRDDWQGWMKKYLELAN